MRMHPSLCLSLLLLLLLTAGRTYAQKEATFKGVLIDSIERTPVEKCTVQLLDKKGDSSRRLSDSKGAFSFVVKNDTSVLVFQHVGYAEKRLFLFLSQINKNTDTIYLSPADKMMEDVIVKAKVPPIVIRDDTTEFTIDSSMFEPYDPVEELLKRLPGLEIDAQGKMTYQGKPITRILVDGEELFGGDPTFSLKKLPAGMVAKIQVMDTKTLEQLFTNTPSDGEDKTLNIKLKEGNKVFSSADATAGTKNQLDGNGTLSLFDGPRKLSVTGGANSSNKIGIGKIAPGPSSSSANINTNYSNKWGNMRFGSSYGYNEGSNRNRMYRERTQAITADTSLFSRAGSLSDYNTYSHRANVNANWFIDSSSTFDLALSIALSRNKGMGSSSSSTLENGALRSQSTNSSTSTGQQQNTSATLNWTKRLNRKGRALMISGRYNVSGQESDAYTLSLNTYFKNSVPVSGDTLNRQTKTTGSNSGYSLNLTYIEPLTKQLNFTVRGNFDFNSSNSNRELYNLDSVSRKAEFDSVYSAKIFSSANTQNINASLAYINKKWNFSTGLTTVFQQAIRTLQKERLRQDLLRYSPSVNASFFISKEKSLRLNFSANTVQPTIEQLQPVPDNSNPLYVRLGNPDLKTSFPQSYGLAYNYRNQNGKSLTANLGYSPTGNQIVNSVFYDEYRRQTSKYINVNGVYALRGNVSFSNSSLEDKKTKTWSASSGANYGRQVYFQANQLYYSRNYSTNIHLSFSRREMVVRAATYTVSLTSSYNRNWTPADTKILNTTRLNISPQIDGACTLLDFIYVNASYQVWYNKIDYHSSLRRVDEYSIHQLNGHFNFRISKTFWVQGQATYQYNTSVPEGSNNGTLNNNISATASLLKGRGQLSFVAQDLFGRNQNLRRAVGENYIEDVQIDNLRNYFTLKVQYNFNRLEKRKETAKNR